MEEIVASATDDVKVGHAKAGKTERDAKGRKLAHETLGRRPANEDESVTPELSALSMPDVSSMQLMQEEEDDSANTKEIGSKTRKLSRDDFPRRRNLQTDIFQMDTIGSMPVDGEDITITTSTSAPLTTTMTPDEDDTAPFTVQSIHCTWLSWFDDDEMGPRKACRQLNDGNHTVPYSCTGTYANVCCTESDLLVASMDNFGDCTKIGSATVRTNICVLCIHCRFVMMC